MAQEIKQGETKVEEEPTPVEFGVSHCQHSTTSGRTEYSLDVNIEDCHVDMTASGYQPQVGSYVKVGIYNLQPSDIKALGEAIIKEALKIEMEQAETPA